MHTSERTNSFFGDRFECGHPCFAKAVEKPRTPVSLRRREKLLVRSLVYSLDSRPDGTSRHLHTNPTSTSAERALNDRRWRSRKCPQPHRAAASRRNSRLSTLGRVPSSEAPSYDPPGSAVHSRESPNALCKTCPRSKASAPSPTPERSG